MTVASGPDRLDSRIMLPAACLAAVAVCALLHWTAPALYDLVLRAIGLVPLATPFLDTAYVLASGQCAQAGIDIYAENPCDPLGRPYDYSPVLIALLPRGVSVAWTDPVGVALALAFCLSLALLPRVAGRRGVAVMLAGGLSTMTAYAVERGNIDALIGILMIGAAALLGRTERARFAGYGFILFAGLLKFYPFAALVVLARERRRTALGLAVLCLGALLAVLLPIEATVLRAVANRPAGFSFTDGFAAANLPLGLTQLLLPNAAGHELLAALLPYLAPVVGLALTLRALIRALATARSLPDPVLPAREAPFLVIGSALLVGCFFSGFSIYYRGVFFLLVLPGLLHAEGGRGRAGTAGAILFLMWSECFRQAIVQGLPLLGFSPVAANKVHALFWLIRELVWWQVVAVLLGVVFAFGADGPWGRLLGLPALLGTGERPAGRRRHR
jgi:hypothetical protein